MVTYCKFPIRGEIFDDLWNDLDKKLETKTLKEIINKEGENNPLFIEITARELPTLAGRGIAYPLFLDNFLDNISLYGIMPV